MPTPYHNAVQSGLLLLGEDWKAQRKIKNCHRGVDVPLSLVDPRTKRVVNYQPDAYYILKNNKKLIFEVLDSEETKQDLIISDIILSFLLENVDALIFIFSGSKASEDLITAAIITIYKKLIFKGVPDSELPSMRKTAAYALKKEEAADAEQAKTKLMEYANEDKWWRQR